MVKSKLGLAALFLIMILMAAVLIKFFYGKKSSLLILMEQNLMQKVQLKTSDGIILAGDFYVAKNSSKGVILLHMMPANKLSWRTFSEKLQSAGFNTLAIDLRGHGESQGGPDGYKSFTDEQHQSSKYDVEAAYDFLKNKGITSISMAGASIGANLALRFFAKHSDLSALVLLSAGINYRGIFTEESAKEVKENQAVYFVASMGDERQIGGTAGDIAKTLYDECSCKKGIKIFDGAEHGTDIFFVHPEFMDELVMWLENNT